MSKNSQPSSRAVWIMRMLVSLLGRLAGSGYVTPASGHHSKSLHPACFSRVAVRRAVTQGGDGRALAPRLIVPKPKASTSTSPRRTRWRPGAAAGMSAGRGAAAFCPSVASTPALCR